MIDKSGIDTLKFDKDVQALINDLDKLNRGMTKRERKKMLSHAAGPVIGAAKAIIESSTWQGRPRKPHHRYSKGQIVATYSPGHLAGSIKILPSKDGNVYIGPKLAGEGKASGRFTSRRSDAWYAHFLEWGTVKQPGISFLRRGYDSTKSVVMTILKAQILGSIKNWESKNWTEKYR